MIATTHTAEKTFTLAEYFEIEEKATYKSEFQNGKIIAMSGGSIDHGDIMGNIFTLLKIALKGNKDAKVYNSEVKIFVEALNQSLYADASVVCGAPEKIGGKTKRQAIQNPAVVIEVLSDSTEGYDRGDKFKKYQKLPSFKEYILIDQSEPIVDVFIKENDVWKMYSYIGKDENVKIQTLDLELKMEDIYEDVEGVEI